MLWGWTPIMGLTPSFPGWALPLGEFGLVGTLDAAASVGWGAKGDLAGPRGSVEVPRGAWSLWGSCHPPQLLILREPSPLTVGVGSRAPSMPRTPSRMGSPILAEPGDFRKGPEAVIRPPAHLVGLGSGGSSPSLWSPCARLCPCWLWAPKGPAHPRSIAGFLITPLSPQAAGTGLHRDTLHHGRAAGDGGSQPHGGCQGWVSLISEEGGRWFWGVPEPQLPHEEP